MRALNIHDKNAYVVGHFFSIDGDVGNRIGRAFTGPEASSQLEDAFNTNSREDFAQLAHHPDPTVRKLVAHNFEQLDVLAEDEDEEVRSTARFIRGIILPVKAYPDAAYK